MSPPPLLVPLISVEIRSFFCSIMGRNVSQTALIKPTNFYVCIEVPAFLRGFILLCECETAMSNADPALLLANNTQSKYRVIHKSVKHFKNSQQIDYSTDHGNSYADRERNSPSFFLYMYIFHRCSMYPPLVIRQTSMR